MAGDSGNGCWASVVDPPVSGRPTKPRDHGLTMVIDKGLGLKEVQDLLTTAAEYMDFIKLAFGTSVLYPDWLLREKIAMIRAHGVEVYPGGTLLEVAVLQGRYREFLERAADLGFSFLEVSEGTVNMKPNLRAELIRLACREGFGVVAEVGKKDRSAKIIPSRVRDQVWADLDAGAYKVIIEGRDSGRGVGIYNMDGSVREELFNGILEEVGDPCCVIWEAPMVSQQQKLLLALGPGVNLGNVQTRDVLSLEAARVGLRGETLKASIAAHPDILSEIEGRPNIEPVRDSAQVR